MTTAVVACITIVSCIILSASLMALMLYLGAGETVASIVLIVVDGLVIFLMFGVLTTFATRLQADYDSIMARRPACINEDNSITCLEEYRDWVEDSIQVQNKIDSLKASLAGDISKAKGGR